MNYWPDDDAPHRRVRAGGPPPDDLPIQPSQEETWRDKLEITARYIALIAAMVFAAIGGAVIAGGWK